MWKRLPDNDENLGSTLADMIRGWSLVGEEYPRLSIGLYRNYLREEGVRIDINRKDSLGSYWRACNLPMELVEEFCQMLTELATAKEE